MWGHQIALPVGRELDFHCFLVSGNEPQIREHKFPILVVCLQPLFLLDIWCRYAEQKGDQNESQKRKEWQDTFAVFALWRQVALQANFQKQIELHESNICLPLIPRMKRFDTTSQCLGDRKFIERLFGICGHVSVFQLSKRETFLWAIYNIIYVYIHTSLSK